MWFQRPLSRRQFISSAASLAGASYLARPLFGSPVGALGLFSDAPADSWRDQGVINLASSPHAKLKTVPVRAVTIQEGFWSKRRATNVNSSIPSMHAELIEHGRMDNFLRLAGKSSAPQRGPVYSDSDMYKWIEAVGFVLQSEDQPQLRQLAQTDIREIVAVQEPSGYLNTYYVQDRVSERMLWQTQTTGHELYNIGHLLQGSIAYYRATGDPMLLEAGMRFVDNFLLPNYGPGKNQKPIVAGHPEIEMSLIELYRTTGNHKYVDLAGYILQGDPRVPLNPRQITYMFCGIPFTSRTHLEGHAVRAMYACCGATDYYLETGDPSYFKTLQTLSDDLIEHQLYVTGGVGARSEGEAFGDAYELPNARAYGESCAAIGNMMWNARMLAATGKALHADVMECALYNGINSGMSLDGRTYCYRNPLAYDPIADAGDRHTPSGRIRNPWYDTTCCPPNLERTFASLPGYFYSTASDGIYVHFYDNSELRWKLDSGNPITITQTTRYPWEGDIAMRVSLALPEEFTLSARIPGWSRRTSVKVNGKLAGQPVAGEYLALRRTWTANDLVEISFDMEPQVIHANPAVADDTGRITMQRGPIIFCMEQLDQAEEAPDQFPLMSAKLAGDTSYKYEPNLLDGVGTLEHSGAIEETSSTAALYSAGQIKRSARSTSLKLIPYYAWANRASSSMQVWIPYIES
ncbi:glycoside hydrolase family 127 protein [Alloacidobacterium sp.]|uniref:glycoside hydrolase family 127 protein n=1 Tax=Alloacidobacterium sp. TaxID=2951999 RepID=UPI002D524307|nr:beta-L-arabinofuranosidase domain-containing protein [Alloacidobacterium sp.]HYK34976.1 beta-L-arabinofuranosidase domain-containing protein [Alloacidobacterium sp.]